VLQCEIEPENRRVYEEIHAREKEFGRDPDLESPSRTECKRQVCVCISTCVSTRSVMIMF